jgi:hypothetical protein
MHLRDYRSQKKGAGDFRERQWVPGREQFDVGWGEGVRKDEAEEDNVGSTMEDEDLEGR